MLPPKSWRLERRVVERLAFAVSFRWGSQYEAGFPRKRPLTRQMFGRDLQLTALGFSILDKRTGRAVLVPFLLRPQIRTPRPLLFGRHRALQSRERRPDIRLDLRALSRYGRIESGATGDEPGSNGKRDRNWNRCGRRSGHHDGRHQILAKGSVDRYADCEKDAIVGSLNLHRLSARPTWSSAAAELDLNLRVGSGLHLLRSKVDGTSIEGH